MNISRLLKTTVFICGLSLLATFANAQPGNGKGNGLNPIDRRVDLFPTANSPRDDASASLWIGGYDDVASSGHGEWQFTFRLEASRLTCRGITFSSIERDTAPFENYLLKVNGEPIVTFNTACRYGGHLDGIGGDWRSTIVIHGAESFEGWLDYPRTDPIHAEVYLESPMSDPPTSTLVLEGWLVE